MTSREHKELERFAQMEVDRQRKNQGDGEFQMTLRREPKGLTNNMLKCLFGNELERL